MGDIDDYIRGNERRPSQESLDDKNLQGLDIVKRNEYYIAKHREAEYQRQRAESEQKLKEVLGPRKWGFEPPKLDETSTWYDHTKDPNDPKRPKYVEPGPSYSPLFEEHPAPLPRKGETSGEFRERQEKHELYGGRQHFHIHTRAHVI